MNTNIKIIPLNEGYLCFDSFTDADKAKAVFTQRFGVEPTEARYEPENRILVGRASAG